MAGQNGGARAVAGAPHNVLCLEDIESSKAHAAMLADTQILTRTEASAIMRGLDDIRIEIESGAFRSASAQDSAPLQIEQRLTQIVGDTAQRLGTARSAADQTATDLRLWARRQAARIDQQLLLYQRALAEKAHIYADAVMPLRSQPVTFGHYLVSHVERAARDRARFADAAARLNECPLGASLSGGTSFPIDRRQTAQLLGFSKPMQNAIDAISAQDFMLELLSVAAICASHLTQLADDFTIWAQPAYGFLGTSALNGEGVAERHGRIVGALVALLSAMRNTPPGQNAQDHLFHALGTLSLGLEITTRIVEGATPDIKIMRRAAEAQFTPTDDMTEWLLRVAKLTLRQAQSAAQRLTRKAEQRGVPLAKFTLAELQAEHAGITADFQTTLKASTTIKNRMSEGGTAPKNVKAQAKRWLKNLHLAS